MCCVYSRFNATKRTRIRMSPNESFMEKAWSFTKSYLTNVGSCYLEFVVPVAIFLAFNASAEQSLRDNEKIGLMWLNYSQTENDLERETKFPAHAPETAAQKKRVAAAQATQAATSV